MVSLVSLDIWFRVYTDKDLTFAFINSVHQLFLRCLFCTRPVFSEKDTAMLETILAFLLLKVQ